MIPTNQTLPKAPARNSAVELLRIVAMLMIVLSHICCHSGFDYTYSMLTVNRLFVQFGYLGNLGVAIFLLISGYFQYGKPFRPRSLTKLLAQVWFYSVSLFLIFRFFFDYPADSLLPVLFPTISNQYWFFTAYVVLLLLSPFLNALADALTRPQLETMLIVMLLLWVVIPTLTEQQMYASQIPQFLLYYLIGVWMRKYPDNPFRRSSLRWGMALGSLGLLYLLTVVLAYCERFTPEAFGASFRFYDRNSMFIVGCAVGMFSLAVYGKPFVSRFINTLGSCTFGVYLIHDNPAVRELLWQDWLNWNLYFTSGSFILRLILSVFLVYTVCTVIEFLRQKTVAKPMEKIFDAIFSPLLKKASF